MVNREKPSGVFFDAMHSLGAMAMRDDSQETRAFIKARLKQAGLTMKDLSLHLGRNHAYIQNYIEQGTPRRLHAEDFQAVADKLKVTTEDLRAGRVLPERERVTKPLTNTLPNTPSGGTLPHGARPVDGTREWGARDVPLLGGVVGGREGVFVDNGSVLGWVDRPPSLIGVKDAYAVTVFGESVYPRYNSGESVWVNPHLPLLPGKGVVIHMAPESEGGDHTYFIKVYKRRTAKELVCEQYNPPKDVKYPLDRVMSAHRIVFKDEG